MTGVGIASLIFSAVLLPMLVLAQTGTFQGGDIFTAVNNTDGQTTWANTVNADPGEVIEFRVLAWNISGTTINNVKVTANLPSAQATSLTASATVSGDNAASVSDTVVVNVVGGTQQGFAYLNGHARICMATCQSAPDTVTTSGISVGNLGPGESAQVLWKAHVTNFIAAPTPTPTPSPSPSPAGAPQQEQAQAQVQEQQVSVTQSVSQQQSVNVQAAVAQPTPSPSPAPQVQPAPKPAALPKAGGEILALPFFSSFVGVGWLLRRRFRV